MPGIGKSRLVGELFRQVDGRARADHWRQGRCLPYGESVTFWALGEIVKARGGDPRDRPSAEAGAKLQHAVRLVPEESEARWLEAELRALVGLAGDGARAPERTAPRRPGGGSSRRSPSAGPAVLVFEDLHWADDGLWTSSTTWSTGSGSVPLLIVGTARPELLERRPAWGGGKANATTISLQPLGDDDTSRLIAELLEQTVQLGRRAAALLEHAGGNPCSPSSTSACSPSAGRRARCRKRCKGVIAARLDALPRPRRSCCRRLRCTARSSGSAGVASDVAATKQTQKLVCARSNGRTSSGGSGSRRSQATAVLVPARPAS